MVRPNAHPLISDQIDWILLEPLLDDPFDRLKVLVFEENLVTGIPSIQGVVDLASKVGTWSTRHAGPPKKLRCKSLNLLHLTQAAN